jgi:hypothetical protein
MTPTNTRLSVSDHDGNVVLETTAECNRIVIDPETARQLAESIARAAYYCHYGIVPNDKKSILSEQKRTMLITRASHIIRDLTDKRWPPGKIAVEVVDTILSEVL